MKKGNNKKAIIKNRQKKKINKRKNKDFSKNLILYITIQAYNK